MNPDVSKPDPEPSGTRPPPRPPHLSAIGLGPEDDPDKKRRVTITRAATGDGKFDRQSGTFPHYGHLIVQVEPHGKGKGVIISSEVSDGTVPQQYIKPATEGIREALDGMFEGRPVVDIIVRIVGGSWDKHASNELAFKLAGIFAIKDAVKRAKPIAIE